MADEPNILVIWGDDIGITNLSCYSDGLMGYRTPNISRLDRRRPASRSIKPWRGWRQLRRAGDEHGPRDRRASRSRRVRIMDCSDPTRAVVKAERVRLYDEWTTKGKIHRSVAEAVEAFERS